MKKILTLVIIFFLFILYSCNMVPSSNTCTITFDTDGGSEVANQVVEKGFFASKPSNPVKNYYVFLYWTLNDIEYDFNSPVEGNITLVAKWELVVGHVHYYIPVDEKGPTCVQLGYITYECVCGIKETRILDYVDHDLVYHDGQSSTPETDGWKPYYTCKNCDYTTFEIIPAGTGKVIELTYSGYGSDKDFNEGLFELFKEDRKVKGDPNTYVINYLECGPDAIDSTVLDWGAPNAPDVYEAASDKINVLYQKGAIAKVTGSYKTWIEEEMTEFAIELVKLNGEVYAYPYMAGNTYYLQYDASVFTAEEVASIETLLDAAAAKGYKVGYNLETAYWGGPAMFTFGADFAMQYDEDGNLIDIICDFDSEKGLKAAKAIYKIMNHAAWVNESGVPGYWSSTKAVIGGTWDIAGFKELWCDDYACATMPTVTIDGETTTLGCFLGGQIFGVNPIVSQGDNDRFVAAQELAKFLSSYECQIKRYIEGNYSSTDYCDYPTSIKAQNILDMIGDPNIEVLKAQYNYARPLNGIPSTFWNAPTPLVAGIKDGTITEDDLQAAVENFNAAIKAELNN